MNGPSPLPGAPRARAPTPAAWLMILVVAGAAAELSIYVHVMPGIDLYQFWLVGREVQKGTLDVYSDEARTRLGSEYQTASRGHPRQQMAASFRPVLYLIFQYLSVLVALVAVAVACRWLRHDRLAVLAALLLAVQWMERDVRVGNVNRLQLAFLVATTLLLRPSVRYGRLAGGCLWGLAVAFKPNLLLAPFVLVLGLAVARRWRAAGAVVVGGPLAAALAIMWSSWRMGGWSSWSAWLRAVRTMPDSIATLDLGNFGLVHLVAQSWGLNIGWALLACALALTGLALRRRAGPRASQQESAPSTEAPTDELLLVTLGCLLGLLTARLVWLHYYLLALPMVLIGLRPRASGEARPVLRALTIGGAVCLTPSVYTVFTYRSSALGAVVVNVGLLSLVAVGLIEIAKGPLTITSRSVDGSGAT
ncbi:MAG: DUF2029 domain-containing protein [Deltaproteobacteria bacterium]|nr:MAG: DUF2029 domain-containing protein [Deltaproteobacteria bacterium]